MASLTSQQREVIRRCQKSAIWFMRNFVKIKHPGAGIVPFRPFDYQENAIRCFRQHRLNIFRKTRQCFVGDTMVGGPGGPKRIDSIRPGDEVWSYDHAANRPVAVPVQEVYINDPGELWHVQADGHSSFTTYDHRYLARRGGRLEYVEAYDLVENDALIGMVDGRPSEHLVYSSASTGEASVGPLYDLRVPPHDNYCVDNVFVHNCGISKVSGVFALWYGMFSAHKTILIVSRKDDDAMNFLSENIKLPFNHLPEWMRDLWKPLKDNEHELILPNGTKIKSLTSHPEVLRSNASSLNIIDEAAFIDKMDVMWAAGWPTLQHGGAIICISTTNGVGNWYWNTWTDAEAGANDFNPLMVNWWDMKWSIEYRDSLSGQFKKICPTDGIVKTAKGTYGIHQRYGRVELRPEVYGPYWSPWLEEQYRGLQEKGEGWKFDQEVLASFIGSGNTVMPKSVLVHVGTTINDNFDLVTGNQVYVHPASGEQEEIDFTPSEPQEGLWVWRKPVAATPDKAMGGKVIEEGRKAHAYVMGVDIATGKGRDYHAIEVFDVDAMEQVAEGMFHCLPAVFKKIIDRVGRWYNCALMVVERNNGGDHMIDDLNTEFHYPRLWRKSEFNGRSVSMGQYGFFTGSASKPALNKFLIDFIRDKDGEGIRIYSRRLWKQLQIYVRKRDKAGRDTGKTEAESGVGNHDDLVMATAMALVALPDSYGVDATGSIPFGTQSLVTISADVARAAERQREMILKGDGLMPTAMAGGPDPAMSAQEEMNRFTRQLGGLLPADAAREAARQKMGIVSNKKHQL